jgi:hypothetical protein
MNNVRFEGNSGSGGFLGLLAIAFIVLKLCGVIAWSWLWVLSPIWIPLALVAVVLFFIFIGALFVARK